MKYIYNEHGTDKRIVYNLIYKDITDYRVEYGKKKCTIKCKIENRRNKKWGKNEK